MARAGRTGSAYSLISSDELPYFIDLHLFLSRPVILARPDMENDTLGTICWVPHFAFRYVSVPFQGCMALYPSLFWMTGRTLFIVFTTRRQIWCVKTTNYGASGYNPFFYRVHCYKWQRMLRNSIAVHRPNHHLRVCRGQRNSPSLYPPILCSVRLVMSLGSSVTLLSLSLPLPISLPPPFYPSIFKSPCVLVKRQKGLTSCNVSMVTDQLQQS